MRTPITSPNAANNPEFLEDIRDFSSDLIFKLFLESEDKQLFLRESHLSIRKYIRVFLHGYTYEVNFEKKYGNLFFTSTNSTLQKGIISVFLVLNNYNKSEYNTYLSSLGYEQLDAILDFFRNTIEPLSMLDKGIDPILVQLRTRKEYLKVGLGLVNKE